MDWEALTMRLFEDHQWDGGNARLPRSGAKLTEGEWVDLLNEIRGVNGKPRIPVTIASVGFGFNIGLLLWSRREEPYPGAVVEPTVIFAVWPEHHPSYDEQDNRLLLYPGEGACGKTSSWDVFAPLVDEPENLRLIEENGLCPLRPKEDYAY